MTLRLLAAVLLVPALTFAQGTTGPTEPEVARPKGPAVDTPDTRAARDLVTRYLTTVKAKKWADGKKLLHPETVKAVAERKRRLGKEDHPMAPWFHEKGSYYLKEFKVVDARPSAAGTIVVETSEDNYQVEEKGISSGDEASYLVGRKGGKWFMVDKKRNETFSNDSIKLGYKDYFDKVTASKEEEE